MQYILEKVEEGIMSIVREVESLGVNSNSNILLEGLDERIGIESDRENKFTVSIESIGLSIKFIRSDLFVLNGFGLGKIIADKFLTEINKIENTNNSIYTLKLYFQVARTYFDDIVGGYL